MASVYDLKPKFQNLLRPLCRRLARVGVTANQVTITAAFMSIAEGAWIGVTHGSRASLIALPVVLFLRMALNAIDGMLAREFDQKTRLGAWLNEIGDIVSDVVLYLPFAFIPGMAGTYVALFVLVAVISELVGIIAINYGGTRRYDGPFGKSDRALFFGVFAIVLAIIGAGAWSDFAIEVAAILAAVTVGNRLYRTFADHLA